MGRLLRGLRERLIPAVLTASGMTLLAMGFLQYGTAQAQPAGSLPAPSPLPGIDVTYVAPSLPPLDASLAPSPSPSAPVKRTVTRIVIEPLGIDLPVIRQPNDSYPWCNVAMRLTHPGLGQPGSGKSVYLYAHARDGMFGPLYERITLGRFGGSKSLIHMPVEVYTSDNQRFVYEINLVYPQVSATDGRFLDKALAVKQETLWLQTSTGHGERLPKLQVTADLFAVDTVPEAAAHPTPHPVVCG
jgi:hypothetical protein